MLTPRFELSQSASHVVVVIHAPYVKAQEVDWYIEGPEFKFHVAPYFLRLTFEQELAEDGTETAQYDIDSGNFTVQLPKKEKGQHFTGLELQTALLSRRAPGSVEAGAVRPPLIEVMESRDEAGRTTMVDPAAAGQDLEIDWSVDQELAPPPVSAALLGNQQPYGFDNNYSGILTKLQANSFPGVTALADPDATPREERHSLRKAAEDEAFDEEHYMADLAEGETLLKSILTFQTPWTRVLQEEKANGPHTKRPWCYAPCCRSQGRTSCYTPSCDRQFFSQRRQWLAAAQPMSSFDRDIMHLLPKKELAEVKDPAAQLLGLIDILFAYAYDFRTNEGESTVESGWTICTLSSTLSYLVEFTSLKEVLVASARRSLCFPLYRHWELTQRVLQDVRDMLSLGRHAVLKAMLNVYDILRRDDGKNIMINLYITDYCLWLQRLPDRLLETLARHVANIHVLPCDVGFPIETLDDLVQTDLAGEGAENKEQDQSGDEEEEEDSDDEDDEEAEEGEQ